MIEADEVEAILEKIWDIHDKLSDAIHSISRTHFLNIVKTLKKPAEEAAAGYFVSEKASKGEESGKVGYVFVKDVGAEEEEDEEEEVSVEEAKSLNAIRAALENLEDQLEFFHTVQLQQRAERDAAIARLEQSRIVLAMRLADHQGKKYKVIEEALAFVGGVHNAGHFITPEQLFESSRSQSGESSKSHEEKRSSILVRALASSFTFAKRSLKLDDMGSLLGHAALVAVSMVALFHLHPLSSKSNFSVEVPQIREDLYYSKRSGKKASEGSVSSGGLVTHLDVLAARG